MKTHRSLLLFYSIILTVFSCSPDYEQQASRYFEERLQNHPKFNVIYNESKQTQSEVLLYFGQIRGSSQGQRIMTFNVMVNLSDQAINLDYSHFTLETPGGNYSQPNNLIDPISIAPGELVKVDLLFTPVNNRRLFMKTGLRGDLNSNYTLHIEHESLTLSFSYEIPEEAWKVYQSSHTKENEVSILNASINTAVQQKYQIQWGKSDFVHADENEISIAGTNLRFNAFQVQDTFNLHVKIVNHGNDLLSVSPEAINSALGAEAVLLSGDLKTTRLDKSQRFIQKYVFYSPEPIENFQIEKGFLMLPEEDKNTPLLADNIKFSKNGQP